MGGQTSPVFLKELCILQLQSQGIEWAFLREQFVVLSLMATNWSTYLTMTLQPEEFQTAPTLAPKKKKKLQLINNETQRYIVTELSMSAACTKAPNISAWNMNPKRNHIQKKRMEQWYLHTSQQNLGLWKIFQDLTMTVPMVESESASRAEDCFDQMGVSALNIYRNEESKESSESGKTL